MSGRTYSARYRQACKIQDALFRAIMASGPERASLASAATAAKSWSMLEQTKMDLRGHARPGQLRPRLPQARTPPKSSSKLPGPVALPPPAVPNDLPQAPSLDPEQDPGPDRKASGVSG